MPVKLKGQLGRWLVRSAPGFHQLSHRTRTLSRPAPSAYRQAATGGGSSDSRKRRLPKMRLVLRALLTTASSRRWRPVSGAFLRLPILVYMAL